MCRKTADMPGCRTFPERVAQTERWHESLIKHHLCYDAKRQPRPRRDCWFGTGPGAIDEPEAGAERIVDEGAGGLRLLVR